MKNKPAKLVTNVPKHKYVFNVTRGTGERENIEVWAESLNAAYLKLPEDVIGKDPAPIRVRETFPH